MQHLAHRHHHGTTAVRPVSDARLNASGYPASNTVTSMDTASPNTMTTFMFWTKHQRPRETFAQMEARRRAQTDRDYRLWRVALGS